MKSKDVSAGIMDVAGCDESIPRSSLFSFPASIVSRADVGTNGVTHGGANNMNCSLRTTFLLIIACGGLALGSTNADDPGYYDGAPVDSPIVRPVPQRVLPDGDHGPSESVLSPNSNGYSGYSSNDPACYPDSYGPPSVPSYPGDAYYAPHAYSTAPSEGSCSTCASRFCGCWSPRLCGSWGFNAEATYFRYHRADGLRVGDDAPGDLVTPGRFEASPRMTLSYLFANNVGVRSRWWQYNTSQRPGNGAPSSLNVDTYNVDLELYERFQLNCNWDVEVSGGVRYNSFDENLLDLNNNALRLNGFSGFGAIAAVELRRSMWCGAFYTRARGGILADDRNRFNVGSGAEFIPDATVGVTELALGYEVCHQLSNGALLLGRVGAEYQQWYNYSSNFTTGTANPEDFWSGSSNVGFAGLTFGLEIRH